MNLEILISNLTNPTLLFFILGIIANRVKSDLQIPESTSKFISLYLLFAIGFKGGQELTHSPLSYEILATLIFGIIIASIIPLYSFYILKTKFSISDAGAVAASYGSVSAVTFVAAASFLEAQSIDFGGHMVAVMALMESPAIIVGVILIMLYEKEKESGTGMKKILHHSFTNASVLMLIGSLVIGFVSDAKQARGIEPFTTDIFKGFLAIFLLEMGIISSQKFNSFLKYGRFAILFGLLMPLINGISVAFLSQIVTESVGNRFMFSILAASASYIAVPAAMRIAAPKADAGLYIPMALAVTFPMNITLGMPLYYYIVNL
ncbi:MAG: sodium-dependent bicarbonate transport family permease [Candidatus Kapabacteria bacterium]|nr:sodium-dependent bicarbonate transport family permease [Ignavibacteriota bacterium]MCW5883963.1 sodium-dependent bicarbonate transport family permease [Candidatus Kapabacteria bacterium]